jgi:hypothetical protein
MSLFISRRENYYVNVKLKNINAVNVEKISLLYKKDATCEKCKQYKKKREKGGKVTRNEFHSSILFKV